MKNKGKFIVFEGPDFCGKSTQIKMIMQNLKDNMVLYTREPGSYLPESKDKCEEVRELILKGNMTVHQEALMFAASRFYHTNEIAHLINQGYTIICDRYFVSSLAYQGYAQGLDKESLYQANQIALGLLEKNNIPIYCFKFELSKEKWLERKNNRLKVEEADSIESKDIHDKVYEFYCDENIYREYTDKLHMFTHKINANEDIESIHEYIMNYVKILIK